MCYLYHRTRQHCDTCTIRQGDARRHQFHHQYYRAAACANARTWAGELFPCTYENDLCARLSSNRKSTRLARGHSINFICCGRAKYATSRCVRQWIRCTTPASLAKTPSNLVARKYPNARHIQNSQPPAGSPRRNQTPTRYQLTKRPTKRESEADAVCPPLRVNSLYPAIKDELIEISRPASHLLTKLCRRLFVRNRAYLTAVRRTTSCRKWLRCLSMLCFRLLGLQVSKRSQYGAKGTRRPRLALASPPRLSRN